MNRLIVASAVTVAIATLAQSGAANAQHLEFVRVTQGRAIHNGVNQSAVYAIPYRAQMNQTTFAVVAVSGGRRASSFSESHLHTINAAELNPTPVFASLIRGDTVGLEPGPDASRPVIALLRDDAASPNYSFHFPWASPQQLPTIVGPGAVQSAPELACDRVGRLCAIVFDTPGTLSATRFVIPNVAMNFNTTVSMTPPVPDRWDISFDDLGAIVVAEDQGVIGVRARSLPLGVTLSEGPRMRVIEGISSQSNPRIDCARTGAGQGCLVLFNQGRLLRAQTIARGVAPSAQELFDGTGRGNFLFDNAYDVAVGPFGYRVAYIAGVGVTRKLRVVDLLSDGTVAGNTEDIPVIDNAGDPHDLRISAAYNKSYSLVTWISGLGAAATNNAIVVRPAVADGGLPPEIDAGVPPEIDAAMEGGRPTQDAGRDQDADVGVFEERNERESGTTPVSPPARGYAYYGGACQCRTSPTQPTERVSPWLPLVCTILAVGLVTRKRKS